jgi:hypothetical protein
MNTEEKDTRPVCNDVRACCFRDGDRCDILTTAYTFERECNFAKADPDGLPYNLLGRKALKRKKVLYEQTDVDR